MALLCMCVLAFGTHSRSKICNKCTMHSLLLIHSLSKNGQHAFCISIKQFSNKTENTMAVVWDHLPLMPALSSSISLIRALSISVASLPAFGCPIKHFSLWFLISPPAYACCALPSHDCSSHNPVSISA